jgi:hypothetical protein
MDLEQLYVFQTNSPLTAEVRRAIDEQLSNEPAVYDRELTFKWLKRADEKFVRILIDPVTLEIVFFDDRAEVYGAAPAWARLLFTKARKQELKNRIEAILSAAGLLNRDAA